MLLYMVGFLSVMIYLCGLTIDLGMMEMARLKMQNAADAAALGAVYAYQDAGTMAAGEAADATLNGYTNGVSSATVVLHNPPTSGAYQGNASAAQVVITQPFKTRFLPGQYTLTAQATAMAPITPCVYLLSQYSTAYSLQGINETVTGDCPFYIGRSYYFNGGSGSTGNQFLLHGDISSSSGTICPTPLPAPAMGDPLLYVTTPVFQACTYTAVSITAASTLNAGTYCGGLTINTSATVTLNPGTYIVTGNLLINGPTLNGAGITFFMTQGGGSSYGTATISNVNTVLSAPTTGTLQGILFFSDRNMPAGNLELTFDYWNPSSTVDGILYMPGQEFKSYGNVLQAKHYNGLVADSMQVNNVGWVASNDYSTLANGSPFRPIGGGLVE